MESSLAVVIVLLNVVAVTVTVVLILLLLTVVVCMLLCLTDFLKRGLESIIVLLKCHNCTAVLS